MSDDQRITRLLENKEDNVKNKVLEFIEKSGIFNKDMITFVRGINIIEEYKNNGRMLSVIDEDTGSLSEYSDGEECL